MTEESPYKGLAAKIRGGKSASTIEFENRKPKITIYRRHDKKRHGSGVVNRMLLSYRNMIALNPFSVVVDGNIVANFNGGETVTIEVEPGAHSVCITSQYAKSRQQTFELDYGASVSLKCCAKLTGIALYR